MAKELLEANFDVTEIWKVNCPHCDHEQDAPFNYANPMQPMKQECQECGESFILTYNRDD